MLDFAPAVAVPQPLIVTVHTDGPRTLVRASGEIDLLSVGELEAPLTTALEAGDEIELDLSRIDFIDSTGLRLLLESRNHAHRPGAGPLTLRLGDGVHVRRLLDLTGVLHLFDLVG